MVEEAPERPAVAPRRANPVPQKPVQAEKAAVKTYPAVSTDQKVRVCEAQLTSKVRAGGSFIMVTVPPQGRQQYAAS
jgi:hypothetical protein